MEQSAKRALFVGVAIFLSIVIISIIVISINATYKTEDITEEYKGKGIKRDASAQSLLGRDKLKGSEIIYLLQAAKKETGYSINIYYQSDFQSDKFTNININNNDKWLKDYEDNISKYIKLDYIYMVNVNYGSNPVKVNLTLNKQ